MEALPSGEGSPNPYWPSSFSIDSSLMRKLLFLFAVFACRSAARPDPASVPAPAPQAKSVLLPPGLAGQRVAVYPVNTMALDPKLNWSSLVRVPGARAHADSILD